LVNFVSETVLVGFKAGVACYLTSTQLPKLFGIKGISGDFWERMGDFFRHLDETNSAALAVGLGALAVLVLGKVLLDPQQLLEAPNLTANFYEAVAETYGSRRSRIASPLSDPRPPSPPNPPDGSRDSC
jgi:MFS superfamily sulfate permease-like transporter